MPDGESSGSAPVHVRDLRPHEVPRRCGLGGAEDSPDYPREAAYLVLLALDRPDRALGLVKRLQGLGVLAEALTLAWPQTHLRVLGDEGAPMATVLEQLGAGQRAGAGAAHDVPVDNLARPLPAFDAKPPVPQHPRPATVAVVPGLIQPLTARERQVLALLAAGRSNRRIAAELYVTLDTVKKHVGRVLDKLGAANRTEAAARALQLGLIA
jgi:LuxR family transcriptional regulator, maltose regulon positive regulatory protein